jgi:hypothetical protein
VAHWSKFCGFWFGNVYGHGIFLEGQRSLAHAILYNWLSHFSTSGAVTNQSYGRSNEAEIFV